MCSPLNASSFRKYITTSNSLGIISMSKLNTHKCFFYRPQRSCGKVMFLHLSLILSTGVVWQTSPGQTHPPRQTLPPAQTPPWQTHPSGQIPTGEDTPWADTPHADTPSGQTPSGRQPSLGRHPQPADGYCSERYASYWNAFLFLIVSVLEGRFQFMPLRSSMINSFVTCCGQEENYSHSFKCDKRSVVHFDC